MTYLIAEAILFEVTDLHYTLKITLCMYFFSHVEWCLVASKKSLYSQPDQYCLAHLCTVVDTSFFIDALKLFFSWWLCVA